MEKMIKKKMTLKFLNRLFRFISITIMISSHHLYISSWYYYAVVKLC